MTRRRRGVQRLMAEARIETERPGRYLVQLCKHVDQLARTHAEMEAHVDWTEGHGVIDFGWGRCTLDAGPGVLKLRAEAVHEEGLQRIQRRVTERLEGFGRRDRLSVTWNRIDESALDEGGTPHG
jgi:hypothetical protein